MRYVIAKTIEQAKLLEADPRVRDVCALVDTFTPGQRRFAWVLWRTPVLRWLLRPFIYRRFMNPYATIVFALAERTDPKPVAPPPAPEVPNGDAADIAVASG